MKNPEIKYPAKICERQKTGEETVLLDGEAVATVADYWRWAHSDFNSNTERGKFAEFLVACSLGLKHEVSQEWGSYDIDWHDGEDHIKIEVKASAYLQIWGQKRLSSPSFSTRPSRKWNIYTNEYEETSRRQADVYVFCLENQKTQEDCNPDPLDLDQWEFFVLATSTLDARRAQARVSLAQLETLGADKVACLRDLPEAIRRAFRNASSKE